jgi:hypothetical protein
MALFGSKDKTPEAPQAPKLQFEKIIDSGAGMSADLRRAKVPNGWLVVFHDGKHGGLTFVPDAAGEWNIRTL